jgi:hypothetical protein
LTAETINLNNPTLRTDQGVNSGDVALNGAVVLGGIPSTVVTIDTDGAGVDGNVTVNGAINSLNPSGQGLAIIAGGGDVSLDDVGNLGIGIGSLSVSSTGVTTLNGDITTDPVPLSGNIDFSGATGGVLISDSININSDGNSGGIGGDVNFANTTINTDTLNSDYSLTIIAGDGAVTLNTVGDLNVGIGALAVTTTGPTTLNGDITTDPVPLSGDVDFSGATGGITLGNSITINSDGNGGGVGGDVDLTGSAVNAAAAGVQGLTIDAGDSGAVSTAALGTGAALAFLTIDPSFSIDLGGNAVTTGPVLLDAMNEVSVNGINAGAATITVRANQDGAGAEGFVQAAGTSVVTTNETAAAVSLTVNTAVGGTGNADLRSLAAGTVTGRVTVDVNDGAINDADADAATEITAAAAVLMAGAGIGVGWSGPTRSMTAPAAPPPRPAAPASFGRPARSPSPPTRLQPAG